MKRIARIVAGLALALAAVPVFAQSWPQRPVKFILPLGPGAGADIGARLYADRLTKRWGQPVVVENRPGGDGVIAINAVIAAKDDHTLLWGPSSTFVGHPYTLDKLPYDPKELVPLARITNTVVTLAVPASMNVGSLKEFMALAREQPGKFNYASVTTVTDIIIAGYFKSAGLDVQKITYKDTVSALNDLVEGRIQMYGAAYAIVRAQAQSGRVKLLAVTNRHRVQGLDLPTVAEAGFPELNFDGLVGLVAARSSGISDAARDRIAADVKAVAADPVVAERLAATAQVNNPGTGAELQASIDEQAAQLAATAKILGMKPKF
jgi:tripartite-type tricarboxylate transporter receptor subunit TctC